MARLKEFRFVWTDAWHRIDNGYDSVLERAENGAARIRFLANLTPFTIDLTDREDAFIADLEDVGVADWNQKEYTDPWAFDGDIWMFRLTYDSHHILAGGMNGYPAAFPQFIKLLHDQYALPRANINNKARILHGIKCAEINEITYMGFAAYL